MKYIKRSLEWFVAFIIASLISVALSLVIISPWVFVLKMWMSFNLNYITVTIFSIVTVVSAVLYLALMMFMYDKIVQWLHED